MADPIINNVVRAQCIWSAPSQLPTDRFVTSWAFARVATGSTTGPGQSEEVAERLREFWLEPVAPATTSVASYMPASITAQGLEIRTYDLGQAPPREPTVYEFPVTAGSTQAMYPREVAITMSFYASRNLPRQRGRVYIGPVTAGSAVATVAPMIAEPVRQVLNAAAQRLALGMGVGDEMDWSVLSPTDGQVRKVTAGWVDDAYDTMRSRGQDPTSRLSWPPP